MDRRHAALSLALVLIPCTALLGQQPEPPSHPASQDTLWFRGDAYFPVMVELPEDFDSTKAYPAVVALHGFDSSYDSFRRVAPALTRAGFVTIFPQAPYSFPPTAPEVRSSWGLNMWTPPPLTDDRNLDTLSTKLTVMQFLPSALERVRTKYWLGRVYALGFSQGAIYAFLTALHNRDEFSGIVAFGLAGFGPDWEESYGDVLGDGNQMPIYLGLGRNDHFIPVEDIERARDVLTAADYRVTLRLFEGGHALPPAELARAVDWLAKESRLH
jgi:phospholipase/carboxylesterase